MVYLRWVFIISVIFLPTVGKADIYRHEDSAGVVHFSNVNRGKGYSLYMREAPPPPKLSANVKKEGYDRNGWMSEYVSQYCKMHDISPALVHAIIKAESDGRRTAVSSKGAKGMMQLMPLTSNQMDVNDPFDPIDNMEGGVKYLKSLLVDFDGDITNAVAAYNAGPTAVRKYGGVPPYKETREYVQRVLRLYRQYSSSE